MTLILFGFLEAEAQTCPLACNDLIQVSVDANCTAEITPDMLLEAPGTGNCNYVVVIYDENDQPLPDDTVRYEHVGMTLKARVTLGANSCWSNIKIEDKMPPQVLCADPQIEMCNDTTYTISDDIVIENCGIADTVVLSDEFINYPCDSIYSGVRVICRYYVDESGNNSDTCCHQIFFARPALVDIDLPTDTTFDCLKFPGADPSITGVPTWNGHPLYPDRGHCEINVDYKDDTIHICPGSYKIIREWLVYDWCRPSNSGNPLIGFQVIKVADENGPIVYCPTTDVAADTFPSDIYTCTGTVLLPIPHKLLPGQPIVDSNAIYIISECSETSYSVKHLAAKDPSDCTPGAGLPNGDKVRYDRTLDRWIATDLPLGCNWFYYTFTDECGNSTTCSFDIYVEDKTPPNAICDQHTVASLGIDGTTKVYAETFDDKSWDNCMIDSFLVRRMDGGKPCGVNITAYRPFVQFCCADVGRTRMVEFLVVDKAGNSNTCMVEVLVQDKIPPIVSCPPNITVSCQFDLSDLSVFGTLVNAKFQQTPNPIVINDPYVKFDGPAEDGEFYDNCLATFDTSSVRDIKCGNGTIHRTFTVEDNNGLKAVCTQVITVIDFEPFEMNQRDWPANYSAQTDCTTGQETDPDVTGRPTINDGGCGDIFVGYEDQTFNKEPDACVKILRKWTVIDWCYYDPNEVGSPGIWTHTQVIKINNSNAPDITSDCSDREFELYGQNCSEEIQLTASAVDDCTAEEDLRWTWSIDLNEDGIADVNGVGNDVTRIYGPGTYEIWWKVQDICGNESECHYKFDVVDKKNPTPYCRDQVVTVVMEQSLSIAIWAKDFDIGSTDNCTEPEDLEILFFDPVLNKYVTSLTFDCSQIGLNTVRMYVRDLAGNIEYCEVTVEIQDPNGLCGTNSFVSVGGTIQDRMSELVSDVQVSLLGMNSSAVKTTTTNSKGAYTFSNVIKDQSYRIVAKKDDDILNGVTTRDLILIQRYLLGLEPLVSPLQLIAADANNNEKISAADISTIRRVILGKTQEFGNGQTSFRFVNSSVPFADPESPWPFEEEMVYQNIKSDQVKSDFDAVKIGDVDGDLIGLKGKNKTRSNEEVAFVADEINMEVGTVYEVPVTLDQAQMINGLQVNLTVGAGNQILEVTNGQMNLCEECYAIKGNTVAINWFDVDPQDFNKEDAIFTLVIEAGVSDQLSSKMNVESDNTPSLLYADLSSDAALITLNFRGSESTEEDFELYQNVPNPFAASTAIGFDLPAAQDVTLTIFDVSGRVHKVLEGHFDQGYHEFIITGEELNVEGVLYYQLTAGTFSSTRKMLMIR